MRSTEILTPRQMDEMAGLVADKLLPVLKAEIGAQPVLLTQAQLAKQVGLSAKTIDRHTRTGAIPSIKLGGARRYDLAEVMAHLKRQSDTN